MDAQGIRNFDLPESIKSAELLKDIEELKRGQSVIKKEYCFNNALATAEEIVIKPAKIIVIEGLFVFHYKSLRELFDLKIFIHAKDSLKLIRRIKRDQSERNYPFRRCHLQI